MRKRIISLILVVVMASFMIAGCGQSSGGASSGEGAKSEAASSAGESTAPASSASATEESKAEESAAEEEPIKLKFMFRTFDEYVPGSIGDQWVDIIEEHCGVEIEWECPPTSSYEENLQLTLLDDKKPDAIIIPTGWTSSPTFIDACKNGLFINVDEMLQDCPNLLKYTAEASFNALKVLGDDRIYGVPRSTVRRADGFSLNEQWLENLGIEYNEGDILTADEFFDILYAFTYNDPDGNGVNDTYGMNAYSNDDGTMVSNLQHIFNLGIGTEAYMIDGKPVLLKYSKEYDNYKQYLAFVNRCWEAGVIDPDAFSIDRATAQDHMAFTGSENIYAGNMQIEPTENNPFTYKYLPAVVASEGATPGYGEFANGIYWFWGITNDCEHPEKVMEVLNYMLSDEQWPNLNAGSLEGVGFVMTPEGDYDFSPTEEWKAKGLESTNPIRDIVRRCNDGDFFVNKSLPKAQRERLSALINKSFDLYIEPVDDGFVPSIASDPTFIEYNAFVIQAEAKIITGEKPVDYWDEVLDGWYSAGGDKYVEELMAYINSKQ